MAVVKRAKSKVMCLGTGKLVPRYVKRKCYDCGKRDVEMRFNLGSDRYEGKRICRVCVQSFKRKSGSFIAEGE